MNNAYNWYSTLIKPAWAPPAWLFGPVWTVLYAIIAVSYARVAWLWFKGRVSSLVALPFALNLVFNFLFTPIQFGLQNNLLASVDILLVLATILWGMKVIYRQERWIAYAQIPYLLWVSFAAVLQLTITFLNA
jgi:translocator protein